MKWELLIVEDDAMMAGLLAELAREAGFVTRIAGDCEQARKALTARAPDVLFTDHRLPDGDGLEILRLLRGQLPDLPAVMLTGYATVQVAVEAFRLGILDLISKPFDNQAVRAVLARVDRRLAQQRRIEALQTRLELADDEHIEPTVHSAAMRQTMTLASKVADSDTPVLLSGETGTGKGLLARWIHDASPRRDGPWFSINCGAVAEGVAESELFGHERGAFTGAHQRKRGLLELADGGTLFLDEINSAAPMIQTRLLEFVQHGRLLRVGGEQPISVDVRLITASNQPLTQEVAEGRFRQDLFYRLNVFPIPLPPLRERNLDIPALAEQMLARFRRQLGREVRGFSDQAMQRLRDHHWPGNVREMENIIHRAVILADGPLIEPHHLPLALAPSVASGAAGLPWDEDAPLATVEQAWIEHILARCDGNKSEAARRLGIDASTLHRKLKRTR